MRVRGRGRSEVITASTQRLALMPHGILGKKARAPVPWRHSCREIPFARAGSTQAEVNQRVWICSRPGFAERDRFAAGPTVTRATTDDFGCLRGLRGRPRCNQSSLPGARWHELADVGMRHAEPLFEGLREIRAIVAWVVELILIFNVQPAGVSRIR